MLACGSQVAGSEADGKKKKEKKEVEEMTSTAWGTLNFLQLQVLESEVQKSEWLEAFQRNYTELIPV